MQSQLAHIDPSAKIGKDVKIYPFAYIDANTVIGDGCVIMPYASVMAGTTLGNNVKIYQGAIVGADPQDFRYKGGPSYCHIGDNTVIREHVIINRGISQTGGTSVGRDCFVMANSHIGHDSTIADRCVLGNGVTVAGNVRIDSGSILSSNVIVHENGKIGRNVLIKGGTRVSSNVPPYTIMAHNPVTYYGVNSYILQKHCNFSEEDIDNIAKAYRHIYQSSTSVFNALRRISEDIPECEIREEIVNFIKGNNMVIAGHNMMLDD